ncbi:helix-turn-helix domain-containing protein [Jatrophihabitans sp.]|uniref:helix-turn-helix domain-containing protein n=1 Tax=Jatrophihabitans sp. TaxID=1932789 RepID=UPI002F207682
MNVDGIKETAAKAPLIGVGTIGDFIREQRQQAQVSLRQLSKLAGVSNPYLSQVERGLRRPSAEILQQIAKGLRISAEQLYVRAGILEDRPAGSDLVAAILADQGLTERQKNVLVEVYESFRRENHAAGLDPTPAARPNAADAATEKE